MGAEAQPWQLFNMDETAIEGEGRFGRLIGSRYVSQRVSPIVSGEHGASFHVSLVVTSRADGADIVPPMIIQSGVAHITMLKISDVEPTWCVDANKTGSMTKEVFRRWAMFFCKHISATRASGLDRLGPDDPVYLVLDGHKSRFDRESIEMFRESRVHVVILPPHTTHNLQPNKRWEVLYSSVILGV